MSAPKTDLEKQEKRHRTPLVGIAASVIFAAIALVVLLVFLFARGNEPGETGTEDAVGGPPDVVQPEVLEEGD